MISTFAAGVNCKLRTSFACLAPTSFLRASATDIEKIAGSASPAGTGAVVLDMEKEPGEVGVESYRDTVFFTGSIYANIR